VAQGRREGEKDHREYEKERRERYRHHYLTARALANLSQLSIRSRAHHCPVLGGGTSVWRSALASNYSHLACVWSGFFALVQDGGSVRYGAIDHFATIAVQVRRTGGAVEVHAELGPVPRCMGYALITRGQPTQPALR
jgi:hypothetical protein